MVQILSYEPKTGPDPLKKTNNQSSANLVSSFVKKPLQDQNETLKKMPIEKIILLASELAVHATQNNSDEYRKALFNIFFEDTYDQDRNKCPTDDGMDVLSQDHKFFKINYNFNEETLGAVLVKLPFKLNNVWSKNGVIVQINEKNDLAVHSGNHSFNYFNGVNFCDATPSVVLRPGKQEISIQLFKISQGDGTKKALIAEMPLLKLMVPGVKTTVGDGKLSVLSEEPVTEKTCSDITKSITKMNKYLPEEWRINEVKFLNSRTASREGDSGDGTLHTNIVVIRSGTVVSKILEKVALHESAHVYFRYMEETSDSRYKEPFEKINSLFSSCSKKPIVNILDESTYADLPDEMGHPHADPTELFASTTSVMLFYPEKLLEKLNSLSVEDKKKALDLINTVRNCFPSDAEMFKEFDAVFKGYRSEN